MYSAAEYLTHSLEFNGDFYDENGSSPIFFLKTQQNKTVSQIRPAPSSNISADESGSSSGWEIWFGETSSHFCPCFTYAQILEYAWDPEKLPVFFVI